MIKRICLNNPVFLLLFLVLAAISGCSNQKDGFVNRAYHNTTARYNGYFYSRESIKEGLAIIKTNHKDDFEEILPLYLFPTDEQVPATGAQMDRAIEKSTAVIKRHSMKIKDKERCRWIDENYMAVAKAHFYKHAYVDAEKIFEFITKEFKGIPTKYDATVWLIITYVEQQKLDEAGLLISNVLQDKDFTPKKKGDLYKAITHYYIARKNYLSAAENLNKAIPYQKKKKARLRLTYIMAQLYNKADKTNEAVKYFDLVAENSHDYAMVFNARIFQALSVQNRVSGYKVKDDLLKMLKDDKNIEFQDQIYYALGEITFKERKPKEALEYWDRSWKASTTNIKQKSKSFLRLAQYYFDQKLYNSAHIYYDSAVAVLPANFPEAAQIKKTSADLDDLVLELNTVSEQDSLLAIALLNPDELDKKLGSVAKILQKQADEDAAAKELQASLAASKPIKETTPNTVGSFYFYNASTRGAGLSDFKKKWGTRKLEDNWRRKNKVQAEGDGQTSDSDLEGKTDATVMGGTVIKKEDLKKNLPLSAVQKNNAHNKIIEALYSAGNIFRERFKDNENAIESFSNLIQRYDTCRYEAIVYYQLYRLYLQKEANKESNFFSLDTKSSSAYYRELILTEYPNSQFAKLVENPEYIKNTQASIQTDMTEYAAAFQVYKDGSYIEALSKIDTLIVKRPNSPISAKFLFLKSRIEAELHALDPMVSTLKQIVTAYPSTAEAIEAKRILDILKSKTPTTPIAPVATPTPIDTSAASPYKINDNKEHYLIVVFPTGTGNVDSYKAAISAFNTKFFPTNKLELSNTFLDNDHQLIMVKSLAEKTTALGYYKGFTTDTQTLKHINNNKEAQVFIITVENFISLFGLKKTDAYLKFYTEHYLN